MYSNVEITGFSRKDPRTTYIKGKGREGEGRVRKEGRGAEWDLYQGGVCVMDSGGIDAPDMQKGPQRHRQVRVLCSS